jgi:hypothetical protein
MAVVLEFLTDLMFVQGFLTVATQTGQMLV